MTEPKPSAPTTTKSGPEVKKPGLEIKPMKDLEPDQSQSEKVRGGQGGGGYGPGFMFSDAALKNQVAPIKDALVKLRELQF